MTTEELIKIVGLILASFGGGAAIIIALSSWLGNLWAKRILQHERGRIEAELAAIRHELSIVRTSYEHHLNLLLNYYDTFWRHYRMCQEAANVDATRDRDGNITDTKDKFLNALGSFLEEWLSKEGQIRLILPEPLMECHEAAINAFNRFRDAIDAFDTSPETRQEKEDAFLEIHSIKDNMEEGLRKFLRTERFLA